MTPRAASPLRDQGNSLDPVNADQSTSPERVPEIGNGNRVDAGASDADSTAGGETLQDEGSPRKRSSIGSSWKNLMGLMAMSTTNQDEQKKNKFGSRLSRSLTSLQAQLPGWFLRSVTFYRIHFAVFFALMMIGTLILYFSPSGDSGPVQFIDCMFMATSALCVSGLISIRVDQFCTFDWVVVMFLMLLGSQVFTSLVPVLVRRYYFKKFLEKEGIHEIESMANTSFAAWQQEDRMKDVADVPPLEDTEENGEGNDLNSFEKMVSGEQAQSVAPVANDSTPEASATPCAPATSPWEIEALAEGNVEPQGESLSRTRSAKKLLGVLPELEGGARDVVSNTWAGETAEVNAKRLQAMLAASRYQNQDVGSPGVLGESMRHEGFAASLHRGLSFFKSPDEVSAVDVATMVPAERRFLELRALEMLSWLVPLYFLGIQLLCFILLYICIVASPFYNDIVRENGVNPVFQAAFQSVSAFANAGLCLFDNNLVYFQSYVPYLLIVIVLLLLGNTMYAPTLRFILIIINRFGTKKQRFVTRYLLDHPRKCYTHLFPAKPTTWLVITVILFNSVEFLFFCVLDWSSAALTGLSSGTKILDGVFQSFSTRNAGFNVINIGQLSGAMLVLYAGMMYVAVYPVYITRQRSREQREVYDDEDLRIFYEDLEEGVMDKGVLVQGKKMLFRDSALVFLAVFIICIIQRNELLDDPGNYTVFNVIFEVISAYGNVGLTLGYTCPATVINCDPVPYSFSGVWMTGSKFIIILVMFLGRHRGLPDNIDAAVTIPDQKRFRRTQTQPESGEDQILIRMSSAVSILPARSTVVRRSSSIANKSTHVHGMRTASGANLPQQQ